MTNQLVSVRSWIRAHAHALDDYFSKITSEFRNADLSIFHQFAPPPTGGGHQFLRALWAEAERRELIVENNVLSRTTRACLFNSFNFDENRLRRLRRQSALYVHRVDGPVDLYRGQEARTDHHIWQLNHEFADKTIFQSRFSLQKHQELGLEFKNPVIILNAADPSIFHPRERAAFSPEKKIRLIAASWSDNPNKGAAVYQWLDKYLDWRQFEFTFIGRSPVKFNNIRTLSPLPSLDLAQQLREHDIYVTASQNDPCSNSLIEALSCGLPAIFLKSGGHPEIVKEGGLGFEFAEEIPKLLKIMTENYENYQSKVAAPKIGLVTEAYLKTLELI